MHRARLTSFLGVLLATSACSGASKAPGRGSGACLPPPEAQARAAAGLARNKERYRKALEAKGLTPISLEPEAPYQLSDEERGGPDATVVTRDEDGRQVRYLVGPEHRGCYIDPYGWTLARSESGELYTVARRPKVLQPDHYSACGCQGDAPSGCGGAAVNPYAAALYPIPDGLEYKGSIEIEYEREGETWTFNGRLPNGKDCPLIPPPP